MDISSIDTSVPRARQLRDEPQSGRYPTREYQQRQPSLERDAADQMDLKNEEPGKSGLRKDSRTMRRENSAQLTEDSHINGLALSRAALAQDTTERGNPARRARGRRASAATPC